VAPRLDDAPVRVSDGDSGVVRVGAVAHPCQAGIPSTPKYHTVAVCRWCGGRFVFVWGEQWVCETAACAARQVAGALTKAEAVDGESPYLFLPLPLQVEIEDSPIKNLLVWGPVGISKSFGGRMHLYKRCRKIPGYRALLLRCTYDQLNKNHLQFAAAEARALGDAKYKGGSEKQFHFDNESVIFMGYLDDEADIGQHMGPEWDEVLIDEAVHMIAKGIRDVTTRARGAKTSYRVRMQMGIEEGRTRLLTNMGGRSQRHLEEFYIDKTPDVRDFPFYRAENYGHITGDLRDNPFLSQSMRTSVLGGLDAARYAQLADGRRDVFPGQFFSSFDSSVHVVR
jgi:hypothetical protein